MIRIEVDSGWLAAGAGRHRRMGDAFAGLGGALGTSVGAAAEGAGDAALGQGIGAAQARFRTGLDSLNAEMQGLAQNLDAAQRAYQVTDESAMPRRS